MTGRTRVSALLVAAVSIAACGHSRSPARPGSVPHEPGWDACTKDAFWTARCAEAGTLSVAERAKLSTDFFTAYPGASRGQFGYGQGFVDFTNWEVRTGRLSSQGNGAGWWQLVNGLMVLDLRDAQRDISARSTSNLLISVREWIAFARAAGAHGPGRGDSALQAAFWQAHQDSLHGAVRAGLAKYVATVTADGVAGTREAATQEIVVRNVDTTAVNGDSTALPVAALIGFATRSFYPEVYPASAVDVVRLELGSAIGHGVGDLIRDARAHGNVGMCSTRWDPNGSAADCPVPAANSG